MRPKKKILLVDANIERLGIRKFMLETNGYRVLPAEGRAQALTICAVDVPDAAMIVQPLPGVERLIEDLRKAAPYCPSLVITTEKRNSITEAADGAPMTRGFVADCAVYANIDNFDLLERVKILSARKRGPRKGYHRKGVQSQPAPVEMGAARIA